MFPNEAEIINWFSQYAYNPSVVYLSVSFMMFISSFGFPLPEEVTILAAGLMVYMGAHPEQYPPPYANATPINLYLMMLVAFLAVVGSDTIVFMLGRYSGNHTRVQRFVRRWIGIGRLKKVSGMVVRYRFWVPAIFRFTPGLRFPGHFSCGMLGVKTWEFIVSDGLAALLSVPTQIYLFAHYGEEILSTIKEVKMYILIAAVVFLIIYLFKKYVLKSKTEANHSDLEIKH